MEKLTKAEEDVMRMIWEKESCTVRDLLDAMEEPKPPHSTVSSVVRILEQKGFVDHKAYGRTHLYFPVITKEQYSRFSLTNVISKYFDNSTEQMLSFLVKEEEIDYKALTELLDKIKQKQ